jgi:hypothetical protein
LISGRSSGPGRPLNVRPFFHCPSFARFSWKLPATPEPALRRRQLCGSRSLLQRATDRHSGAVAHSASSTALGERDAGALSRSASVAYKTRARENFQENPRKLLIPGTAAL